MAELGEDSAREVISRIVVRDIRFPTSRYLDGSDAMNPDPDYSAAYVTIYTSHNNSGDGFVFTIGRGTDIQVNAIAALEGLLVGLSVDDLFSDMGAFWRLLTYDSQLRWLGPEKGVVHMAIGAVVNAVWDMFAKREGVPLWRLLSSFTPQEIVNLVDFRYLTDCLTNAEALAILEKAAPSRDERSQDLVDNGYPAYITSAGWLGYSDEKVVVLVAEALARGFTHLKMKVGRDIDDDVRRVAMVRALVGPDVKVSVDVNQTWEVDEAIANTRRLGEHGIYWVEEPTSPDDVIGFGTIARAVHPVKVATGEHVANRVMFKQFLATGAMDVCQIDACRVGGVNENISILLLAAKFGVPVCPHAGGVGLCEVVQHLSMFDYIAVSGTSENRWIEFADHLHEHFVEPALVRDGRYRAPQGPGSGASMLAASLDEYSFPGGPTWSTSNE